MEDEEGEGGMVGSGGWGGGRKGVEGGWMSGGDMGVGLMMGEGRKEVKGAT